MKPSTEAASQHAQASSWSCLFAFTKRSHAGLLAAAAVSSGLTAALRTVMAVFIGRIFDIIAQFGRGSLSGASALANVSTWCLVLLGLGFANWLANTAFLALWIVFGELQADSARRTVLESLLARQLVWFDSLDHGVSSLLVRTQTQTRELQLATSQVLGFLVCDAVASCASLAIALYHSWKLALVLLATLPVSFVALSLTARRIDPAIRQQKAHLEAATKVATASITAIDLVKVFNGFDRELRHYGHALESAARHYLVQASCSSIQAGYVSFWVISMFVVGFWYGLVLVRQGLQPGHVLTTFCATLAAFQAVESVVPNWLVLSKGMSAGGFLLSVAKPAGEPRRSRVPNGIRPEHCVGDVQLTNVSFAYPSNPDRKVLDGSSFVFPAGRTTFVVGRSGSGKSTVGNLMAKLYEPLAGQILLDGQPLDGLDDEWVRENVTLMQQTSVLFNDSFFNNVALGHRTPEQATSQQVLDACQAALLQSTVASLPHGLDTKIGPTGHQLSGGQKQRVALARARLRNPPVLILDEVTSGLDHVSRSLVMDAIREWRKGKTTIIITHDMSQIGDGEYVYVMDKASVVQHGLKRDMSGLCDSASSTVADEEPAACPSAPRADAVSSLTCRPPRTSESTATQGSRPELHRRPLSGASTAYGSIRRAERRWEHPVSYVEAEKRRFSAFINSRFSSPLEREGADSGTAKHRLPSAVSDGRDCWELTEDDAVSFVFGAAERRKDISSLRQAAARDAAGAPGQPGTPSATGPSLLSTLKTVWPTLGRVDRLVLVAGFVTCLVRAASTPVFAYCLAQLIGAMWSSGDKVAEGRRWALYLVAVAFADGLCSGACRYLFERAGQAWVDSVRMEALRRILHQPRPWFDEAPHAPGRVNECLERNAEDMRAIVGRFIPTVFAVLGIISISVAWALAVSWKLTLVALAPVPLVMGAVKGYAAVSSKWEVRCNRGAEDSSAVLTEIFVNIRVVRALALDRRFERKYLESATHTLGLGLRRAAHTSWLFGLYQSVSFGLTALIFYYGMTLLAAAGAKANVTAVLQVVNLLLFGIGTSSDILGGLPQLAMAQAAAAQLLGYANLPLAAPRPSPGPPSTRLHSPLPVRMRDLAFAYPRRANDMVLRGVSLDIAPGECTAIVGHSGCGKSTIVSLLLGLYAPPSPADAPPRPPLTFAGVSCSDVDMDHLRSTMAYVSQAPFLFPATIAENIAYGLGGDSPHRRSQSVERAARAAGLHEFIASLPQGYDTLIGDGGQALSGGQAQRLSIARALVRQPRLLVMDEPTSALDAESAEAIHHTIRGLLRRPDVAVVVVTHSREMMQAADRIVVLDNGVKVEEGSYPELVAAKGPFCHLISGGQWLAKDHDGD